MRGFAPERTHPIMGGLLRKRTSGAHREFSAMERFSSPGKVRNAVRACQAEGLSVGLVPTMGALHEGHLSLIRASVGECDRTVISIYVNPTQFAPNEDLEDYPRRFEEDCRLAQENGVDLVFCPADRDMYAEGHATYVVQERLTELLEGDSRPTHFRGVLTVVCKLFNIAPADRAYFGQKDFQQTVVVRRMVRETATGHVPVPRPIAGGRALRLRREGPRPRQRSHARGDPGRGPGSPRLRRDR